MVERGLSSTNGNRSPMSQPSAAEINDIEIEEEVLQLITEMDRVLKELAFTSAVFGLFNESGRSILQRDFRIVRGDPGFVRIGCEHTGEAESV